MCSRIRRRWPACTDDGEREKGAKSAALTQELNLAQTSRGRLKRFIARRPGAVQSDSAIHGTAVQRSTAKRARTDSSDSHPTKAKVEDFFEAFG